MSATAKSRSLIEVIMDKSNDIMIMSLAHISYRDVDLSEYQHKDARMQDKYTKVAITVGKKVMKDLDILPKPSRRGLVFTTSTGPISSVKEFNRILDEKNYFGVNPSKFPNIMLSTCMSRVAIEFQINGPTIGMYSHTILEPFRCGVIQILDDLCDVLLLMDNRDNKYCFGTLIIRESMLNRKYKRFGVNCANVLTTGRDCLCV